jgi:hypothetical protein
MTGTANRSWPLFDRSQVAQHNNEAHGHWLIIDALVYDVSELMRTHPGGARILQLYSGRDATQGFRRVGHDHAHVQLLLERARIGAVRGLECTTQADHVAHCAAARSLDGALALVVEMQNALNVDHSFQLPPLHCVELSVVGRRTRYELQRGLETHARFHREYLEVLIDITLTGVGTNVLTPQAQEALRERLAHLRRSQPYLSTKAGALTLLDRFDSLTDHELTVSVACFEVLDRWLLRVWKRELSRALRAFERVHAARLRLSDAESLQGVCDRLCELVSEYIRKACLVSAPGQSIGS